MTESARKAYQIIKEAKPSFFPKLGIILGSGLGDFADQMENVAHFDFQDLPGFPLVKVPGHKGKLVLGTLQGVPLVCLQGRGHFYEGATSNEILTYVRTLKLLGCETLIITGAAGSLHLEMKPGQLVLIKDHINFQGINPLAGPNDYAFGDRFFDMSEAYSKVLRQKTQLIALDQSIAVMEGVYFGVLGPCFETPAEVRAFRALGGDVIGMSVVPEALAARHCGLKILGLIVVTNLASGLIQESLSHEETLAMAKKSTDMVRLLKGFVKQY